jgi:hypothetical protein
MAAARVSAMESRAGADVVCAASVPACASTTSAVVEIFILSVVS